MTLAAVAVCSSGTGWLASGVQGTTSSGAVGTSGDLGTSCSLGEPFSELVGSTSASFALLPWRGTAVPAWSASTQGSFPAACGAGGVSGTTLKALAEAAARDRVTRCGGEFSLASALLSSRFSLFWSLREARTTLMLLFLLLERLMTGTVG